MNFPKFKNLKIGTRLWIWVSVVLVAVIISGVVVWTQVERLNQSFKHLSEESYEMHLVMELSLAINQTLMPINDYLVAGGDTNEPANFEKLVKQTDASFLELEPYAANKSEEKSLLEHSRKDFDQIKQNARQIFAMPREQTLISTEAGRLMEETDILGEHAITDIKKWDKFADAEIAEAEAHFAASQKAIEIIIIILTFFASVVTAVGGFLVVRSINVPLNQLVATVQKIGAGDLNARVEVTSKDEIGILVQSFNQMTDNLLEARKFPENIIRSMTESLIVVTPEAKIKEVNQATLDLLGYQRKELLGEPIEKVFGRAAAAAAETIFRGAGLEKLIKEGFAKDIAMTFQPKKGEKISVSVSGSVMKDEKGKMVGIVIAAKDMRILKKLEEQRVAAAAAAAAAAATSLEKAKREIAEKTANEIAQKVIERDAANQQLRAGNQQLNAANQQIAATQKNLQDKLLELERFNKVAVGRELKMVELKEEIARLKGKA